MRNSLHTLAALLMVSMFAVPLSPLVAASGDPVLSLSAPSGAKPNDQFAVNIMLDAKGKSVSAVELRIDFPAAYLAALSISKGTLLPVELVRGTVSGGNATITLGATPSSPATGSGVIATLTMKAVAVGSADVTFNANTKVAVVGVAGNAVDQMSSARISISTTAVTPPTPPTVTVTPVTPPTPPTVTVTPVPPKPVTPVTPPVTPTVTSKSGVSLGRNVSVGTSGADVTRLQNYLIKLGYLGAGYNTGYYGNLTAEAIRKYQCANGIVCTGTPATTGYGSIGPKTRAHVNEGTTMTAPAAPVTPTAPKPAVTPAPAPTPVPVAPVTPTPAPAPAPTANGLTLGSKGPEVLDLQRYLISKIYLSSGNDTGYFGPNTQNAVKAFQAANGLPATGVVDTATKAKMK